MMPGSRYMRVVMVIVMVAVVLGLVVSTLPRP
jgi:hypothetical protein